MALRLEVSYCGQYAVVDDHPKVSKYAPMYKPDVLNWVFHELKCYSLQGILVMVQNGGHETMVFDSTDFMFHTKKSLQDYTDHIQRMYVLMGLVFDKVEEAQLVKHEFEKLITFYTLKEDHSEGSGTDSY